MAAGCRNAARPARVGDDIRAPPRRLLEVITPSASSSFRHLCGC
jgi:hypothetical protein